MQRSLHFFNNTGQFGFFVLFCLSQVVFVFGFGFLFFLTLCVKHDLNTVATVQEHPQQKKTNKQQQRTKQNKSKGIYTDQATKNNENSLDSVVLSVNRSERQTEVQVGDFLFILLCVGSHRKTLGPVNLLLPLPQNTDYVENLKTLPERQMFPAVRAEFS